MRPEVSTSVLVRLIFAGVLNQIGFGIYGFGALFGSFFLLNADFSFVHYSNAELVKVSGVSLGAEETNMSENETYVIKTFYRFTADDGNEYEDISYGTGTWFDQGEAVTVEYPKGKPGYSRIEGLRREAFGPVTLLVLIFPGVGLLLIAIAMSKNLAAVRLLRNGRIGSATYQSMQSTGGSINDRPIMRMTFLFEHEGNEYLIETSTHEPERLQDEAQETLVYNPDNPGRCGFAGRPARPSGY